MTRCSCMAATLFACIPLAALATAGGPASECDTTPAARRFEFSDVKMAAPVKIVLYAADRETAERAAEAAFDRFDALNDVMSDYQPTSEVRRLCEHSGDGRATPVSDDLWRVLTYSLALNKASDGAFDVTIAPVVRLWRRARRLKRLPERELMDDAMARVGCDLVRLDEERQAVELLKAEMRLDFGGVAKGDAIDQALKTLREHGVTSALIDAGGDVGLSDPPPGRDGWVIGIASLERDEPLEKYLVLANCAVATSGDSAQYVRIDGKRYSHLVDPRTGLGLSDHSSVTVIAPDALAADGLASAVSILGPERGIQLIDATEDTAARITRSPDADREVFESTRWASYHAMDRQELERRIETPGDPNSTPSGP